MLGQLNKLNGDNQMDVVLDPSEPTDSDLVLLPPDMGFRRDQLGMAVHNYTGQLPG